MSKNTGERQQESPNSEIDAIASGKVVDYFFCELDKAREHRRRLELWLLATCLSLNGGSIILLTSLFSNEKLSTFLIKANVVGPTTFLSFQWGLGLAFVAGFTSFTLTILEENSSLVEYSKSLNALANRKEPHINGSPLQMQKVGFLSRFLKPEIAVMSILTCSFISFLLGCQMLLELILNDYLIQVGPGA